MQGRQGKDVARPLKEIDERQVELLAGVGCTVEEIAACLDVSKDTLERRFAALIEKGRGKMRQSLRRKQVERALKGSDTMLIWLGKNLLGQRDKIEQGTPEEFARMSDDELRRILNDPTYEGESLDAEAEGGSRRTSKTRQAAQSTEAEA